MAAAAADEPLLLLLDVVVDVVVVVAGAAVAELDGVLELLELLLLLPHAAIATAQITTAMNETPENRRM